MPATRAVWHVDLPPGAVRSGQNTVELQFSLYTVPSSRRDCGRIPIEQAWAVLHPETSYRLPESLAAPQEITLGNYPYPFLDRSGLSGTTFVFPPQPDRLGPLFQALS